MYAVIRKYPSKLRIRRLITFLQLRHVASKTYFAETRGILTKLCRVTFQSGLLTSVLATAIIIAFLTETEGVPYTFP